MLRGSESQWYSCSTVEDTYEHIVAALKKNNKSRSARQGSTWQNFSTEGSCQDWVSFAEDLLTLVEKAYPTLQAEARELLALNRFLEDHFVLPGGCLY